MSSFSEGAMPIVLGGDHSLGAGSVAAAAVHVRKQGKPLGLIWVDAHGDMNNPASSESGNVHGMPLAALLGSEPAELAHFAGPGPAISPTHTVLVGIRNLDETEKKIVRASKVNVFTMKEIDRLGIAEVMARAITIATKGTGGFHVSYDLDVCDPTVAPGVGTPVKGGLSYREAHVVMESVAESGLMTSFDLVEVNPTLDHQKHDGRTRYRAGAFSLGEKYSVARVGLSARSPVGLLRRGHAAKAARVAA